MIAYIEHHQEEWGGGCSIFNNDVDFDPVGIVEWYYLCGKDKPNYPMPAVRLEVELQPDRVILWRKQYQYWEFQYLYSTIPTKLLNRWAE